MKPKHLLNLFLIIKKKNQNEYERSKSAGNNQRLSVRNLEERAKPDGDIREKNGCDESRKEKQKETSEIQYAARLLHWQGGSQSEGVQAIARRR